MSSSIDDAIVSNNDDLNPPPSTHPSDDEETEEDSVYDKARNDVYEWQNLLGQDVRLKVLSSDNSKTSDQNRTERETLQIANVGDLTWITFNLVTESAATTTPPPSWDHVPITLGDSDVCPGLELAARFLRKGESGLVKIKTNFAFGSKGLPSHGVLPNTDVEFRVTIDDIITPDEFTDKVKLDKGMNKKLLGNENFKANEHKIATRFYKASVEISANWLTENPLDESNSDNKTYYEFFTKLAIDSLNNLSRATIILGDLGKAKDTCIEVIKLDPSNITALIIACNICIEQSEFHEAEVTLITLKASLTKREDGKDTKDSIEYGKCVDKLRRKKIDYKKKEKEMYSKMKLGGEGTSSSSTTKLSTSTSSTEKITNEVFETTTKETSDVVSSSSNSGKIDTPSSTTNKTLSKDEEKEIVSKNNAEKFIYSTSYTGSKAGYVFTSRKMDGSMKLGYFIDELPEITYTYIAGGSNSTTNLMILLVAIIAFLVFRVSIAEKLEMLLGEGDEF